MNIFAVEHMLPNDSLQSYAKRVAASHCDKHQKQVLECWQQLNTNMNVLGVPTDNPSKAYINHPCTKWSRQTLANHQFLYHLCEELAIEMQRRYGRKDLHKSWIRVKENIPYAPSELTGDVLTPFATAMPDSIANSFKCPVEAYREYYSTHKAFFARRAKGVGSFGQEVMIFKVKRASWKNTDKPSWIREITLDEALKNGYIKANDGKKDIALTLSHLIEEE